MSRILMLQCFRRSAAGSLKPKFDQSLGVTIAALQHAGHEVRLLPIHHSHPEGALESVRSFEPNVVYVSIEGVAIDLGRRTLAALENATSATILAGGVFATLMPSSALSMPGVQGVIVGDPDQALPTFTHALNGGADFPRIPGVLSRQDGRAPHFQPAPLIERLDDLPFANRDLLGASPTDFEFEVYTSRGCPMSCAYCPNERIRGLYDESPSFVRRRSAENICDEIDQICVAYPETQRINFPDHPFAMDYPWLEKFITVYEDRCGLPFSCHVRANRLDEPTADLLQRGGCDLAKIEIISGSNFIRNEILDMDTSVRQIERAFELLKNRGIRTYSVSHVGVPYSSEITERDTVRLNRRLKPDFFEAKVYYPFPGTKAAGIAKENGWLSHRGENCFSENKSVLDMPTLPPKIISRLAKVMPLDVVDSRSPHWVHAVIGRLLPFSQGKKVSHWLAQFIKPRFKSPLTPPRRS